MPIIARLDQYATIDCRGIDEITVTTNANISGLGTYFATEFSENIGITTTITANIFPPYDLVYDEFGGTLFGVGQGVYMRQNTDKTVVVYNEIDETFFDISYAILPSTTTINEGQTINFIIATNNVADGTTLYYTIE